MNSPLIPSGDLLVAAEHRSWAESILTQMAQPSHAQTFTQKVNASEEDDDYDSDDFWDPAISWARPYNVKEGVLTIPVYGMLMSGFPYQFMGWATGYEYIERAVARGVADAAVTEIVLDINSPGGTVSGCFDCADKIYEARGQKPIRAHANEHAYSAAYAIASAADSITVARTGGVGSIGVIMAHMEMSGALEKMGVKVTLIYAGQHKADGSPYQPLSEEAQARFQTRIDALYEIFVSTVARNRDMDPQSVRDTEAATLMPQEAVENGLADAVGALDTLSAPADPSETDEEEEMPNTDSSAVEAAANEQALATARSEGFTDGKAEGANDERARVGAILGCDEAEGREGLARTLALETDMSPEAAAKVLGSAEKKAAAPEQASGPSAFESAMEGGENPDLGAEGGEEMSHADSIFASAGFGPAKS